MRNYKVVQKYFWNLFEDLNSSLSGERSKFTEKVLKKLRKVLF